MKEAQKIKSDNQFPVVGIGASAGGLDAFKKLLSSIPEDSGMAYVLVQHLDPNHESLLTELLQKVTTIPVLEISDDIEVKPNHIYVIPRNKMMVANDGVLELTPRPEATKKKLNLPIDFFFESLAEVHQSHAIGVVLSGSGFDGTAGLMAIKESGGITFAQDEKSAAFVSMPNSAVQADVVDFILPPEEIPAKIMEVITRINHQSEENEILEDAEIFKKIISLLRIRKGTDFTYYKQTTIRRRILRRMALNKNEETAAYLHYLIENKSEQDILYQDMLIPVTSFFRDQLSFTHLYETVFPLLLKNKVSGMPIRIWIAGCSTGEEAYSIAICLREFLGEMNEKVQIFATDLSEPAIAKARAGIYSNSNVENLTSERLNRFFTKTNGGYMVRKEIRDMCVFAVHNFLKDPAFGKMDFISCRNVLIYMDPYLQKKALTTFHYSLNPKGFLFLGKTETTSSVSELFALVGKTEKFFSRKNVAGRFVHVASQRSEQNLSHTDLNFKTDTVRNDFQKTADDIVLSKYSPCGVIVNETFDIVHFRGSTGNYLEQSSGKPSHNVLKMARHGLSFELRNILHKARKEHTAVIKENISIQLNGNLSYISIEAIPLPNTIDPHYLILFHDHNSIGNKIVGSQKVATGKNPVDKDLRIVQLEQELARTHEDMRSITEDQEAINEELQSDNQELLSTSEELQSLNEELETSKEELQSTNEELTVVNQEIVGLNEQLTASRDYAEAIVGTIREPLLILDKDLRVKTVNGSYFRTFQVNELEIQGKLIYEVDNKQWDIPALRKLLENILPEKSTFRDFEIVHTFSNIGERILLLNAREIRKDNDSEKLILLAFEDITEQRKAEEIQGHINDQVTEARDYAEAIVGTIREPLLILDKDLRVKTANSSYYSSFQVNEIETQGKLIYEVDNKQWDIPALRKLLENILPEKSTFRDFEIVHTFSNIGERILLLNAREIRKDNDSEKLILLAFEDITEQRKAEEIQDHINDQVTEARDYAEAIVGTIREPLLILDKDLRVKTANSSYYRSFQVNEAETQGKLIYEVDNKQWNIPVLRKLLENILPEKSTFRDFEIIHTFSNIGERILLLNAREIRKDNDSEKLILLAFEDITEQRKAQEIQSQIKKRFQFIADAMPQKVWTADAFGNMDYFNKTWLDYSGLSFDELKVSGWGKIIHPDDLERNNSQWQHSIDTGNEFELEERFLNKDGKYQWHLSRGLSHKDENGKILMWVGTNTEIQEYVLHKEELEKSVAIRTFELLQANESLAENNIELAKMNNELHSFTYVSSHDLQEPLRKIQTFANHMIEREEKSLSESGKDYLNRIQSAAQRMQRLIKDLLAFSRINTADRKFENTLLNAIVDEVKAELAEVIAEKKAIIKDINLGSAQVIPFQFRQLMYNLISNSLKFAKPGMAPYIEITIEIKKYGAFTDPALLQGKISPEKQFHHIAVADNGIGFEPQFSERIFEVFQKLHPKEEYAGTGIGLAIVKRIVNNHNGFITAKGKQNQGVTFDIYIPVD